MGPNFALKIAIAASGKLQRQIAASTGIRENRLSTIVNGWTEPRKDERAAIAAALGRTSAELFNVSEPESVSAA